MSVYAIGDVQGCAAELDALLDRIRFEPTRDRLIFVGDLVNRGPDSLTVLRRVRALGPRAVTVLGNHDLHLLARAHGYGRPHRSDTLGAVLAAADRDELLAWLRTQPLAHLEASLGVLIVHAGLPPQWTVAQTLAYAQEVESMLSGPAVEQFFERMYGNEPNRWDPDLRGAARSRFIVNCLTRLRFCAADGTVDLTEKGAPGTQAAGLRPWYEIETRASAGTPIVFGHWSTLRLAREQCLRYGVFPIDAGCVWGGSLTALRLDDWRLESVPSRQPRAFGD